MAFPATTVSLKAFGTQDNGETTSHTLNSDLGDFLDTIAGEFTAPVIEIRIQESGEADIEGITNPSMLLRLTFA